MGWVGVDVDGAATSGALAWVRLDADGTADVRGATPIVAEHVASLGATGSVIVDGTPYGREALLGEALRTILDEAGADPLGGLGLVHDAAADQYRLTLLVEAARIAGVAPDRVVLVPRSDDDDGARWAAGAAAAMLPAAGAAGGTGAAAAAGIGGGAGALGGAILGSHLLDGGATAVAGGAAAGPVGAALSGPTGAAMTGPAGPPLAGPAGAGAGPVGNVIVPVAQAASKAKWLPILGGAAVGVAAIVGVAVVAAGGDEAPAEADAITVTADAGTTVAERPDATPATDPESTVAVTTPPTTVLVTTTTGVTTTTTSSTTTTTTVAPEGDFTVLLGSWQSGCIDESGGSAQVVYTLSGASADSLSLHASATGYPSPGCSGASQTFDDAIPASITGTTIVDGLVTFQIHTADGNGIMAVDGDTLYLGAFEDTASYPTAFDPMWTCTRV